MKWLKDLLVEKIASGFEDVKKNLVDLTDAIFKIELKDKSSSGTLENPLLVEFYGATGFLIKIPEKDSDDLQMITALHTLGDSIENGFGFFYLNGNNEILIETYRDEDLDFLFLGTSVNQDESSFLTLGDSSSLDIGDKVFVLGSEGHDREIQVLESEVFDLPNPSNNFEIWIKKSSLEPGFSGSPVVNTKGEVVGMVISIIRSEDIAKVIPINDIRDSFENFLSQFD